MNLFKHQERFRTIARERARFAWYAEPGCGKTIGMLAAIADYPCRTLVLAPKSILESAWARDAANFPALRVQVVRSSTYGWAIADADVWVTNYDCFKRYYAAFTSLNIERLVVDESSKIRNPDTAITKKVLQFAKGCKSVYLLSGTPAPNAYPEYWAQLTAIGATTVPYYSFAHRYGYPVKKQARGRTFVDRWCQNPDQAAALQSLLSTCSWALRKSECLDLPPQLDKVIDVPLSAPEAAAYADVRDQLRIQLEDGESVQVAGAAALMKMRQITGGSVRVEGQSTEFGSAKLDALSDVLDELGKEPVVVWFQFREERRRLEELMKSRGEDCRFIDGETSFMAGKIAEDFQSGKFPRLLCHPQAAGHGITLHRASHAVYFALDFSWENYGQSRDRIHRAGMSDTPATYTHLLATVNGEKSVDHAALKAVRAKRRASDAILDALNLEGIGAGAA